MTFVFSYRKYLSISVAVFLFILLATLPGHVIHIDDSWFAEQAYWLVKDGVVRSELFSGLLGYEIHQLAYHKLHIWQDALFIKLFGFSAYSVKVIPLIYLTAFFALAFFYFKRYFPEKQREAFLFLLAFLLVNALIVEHAFVNRPEIIVMFFGFASFFMLRRAIASQSLLWISGSGILAGLAALTHLNGASFIGAGFLFLLFRKNYRLALVFMPAAVFSFAFYFIDILPGGHFSEFLFQFRNDPALASSDFSIWDKLLKLFEEHKRFFRHPKEITFSLLFLFVFWIKRKAISADPELRTVFLYLLCLFVVMGIISPGQKDYYLIYEMPYIAIIMGVTLADLGTGQCSIKIKQQRWLFGLMFLYVAVNVGHTIGVMRKQAPTPEFNAQVVERFGIRKGERVIAPISMVFNQLKYLQIRGVGSYFLRARNGSFDLSQQNFFAAAADDGRAFILIEKQPLAELGIVDPAIGDSFYGYRYLGNMPPYWVFKRISN